MKNFNDLSDTLKDLKKIIQRTAELATFEVASAFLDDSNYYVPMVTGDLKRSSFTWSVFEEGHLEWRTPYARKLFYNPQYNFSRDANPHASGLWAEKAKNNNQDKYRSLTNKQFEKAKDML